jgi:hypothetical protein
VLAYGGGKIASSMSDSPAAHTRQMRQAWAKKQYSLVLVHEAYTLSYDYESRLLLQRLWSAGRGMAARGLQWCNDTIHPNRSHMVRRDANVARNNRSLLATGTNRRPYHLTWYAGLPKAHKPVFATIKADLERDREQASGISVASLEALTLRPRTD